MKQHGMLKASGFKKGRDQLIPIDRICLKNVIFLVFFFFFFFFPYSPMLKRHKGVSISSMRVLQSVYSILIVGCWVLPM